MSEFTRSQINAQCDAEEIESLRQQIEQLEAQLNEATSCCKKTAEILALTEDEIEQLTNEVTEVKQERDEAIQKASFWRDCVQLKHEEYETSQSQVNQLRGALEFYGDEYNYKTNPGIPSNLELDGGEIAQQALKGVTEEPLSQEDNNRPPKEKCEHGKSMADYCLSCGRVHSGG